MRSRNGRGSARWPVVMFSVMILLVSGASQVLASDFKAMPHAPAQSNILRIAQQDDLKGLNPYAVNDVWSSNVIYNVWGGLVNRDWKTQTTQPWIAVGWGVDQGQPKGCDNCNVTVEYKLGDWENKWGGPVYFHDGQKVAIDDILFSYGMALYNPRWISSVDCILWDRPWSDPPYGDSSFMKVMIGGKEGWLGVKKIDEHTLQFRLAKTYVDFFDDTMSVILFPKHVWEKHINVQNGSGDYMTWDMDYNDQTGEAPAMVGSGAFAFHNWIKGQNASLRTFKNSSGVSHFDWTKLPRVDEYGKRIEPEQPAYDPSWTKNHPIPYIDGIEFKIYKTVELQVQALKNNEIDYVGGISSSLASGLKSDPNIQLFYTPEPGHFYYAFNMRRKTFGYEDFTDGNFTDVGKPFRKAMAYITDKQEFIADCSKGDGVPARGPISLSNKIWFNDSLPEYRFNETLAKWYLDNAGWKDTDGDGWREFPEIGDSEIEFMGPGNYCAPIDPIAYHARRIGINMKYVFLSFGEIVQRIDAHDFQMFFLGWRIGGSDPGYLFNFFHSSQVNAQNYPGYHNDDYDKLLDEYRQTSDSPKRIQLIKDAQGNLVENLPTNWVFHPVNIQATRSDRFVGWLETGSGIFHQWSLYLIHAPTNPMKVDFDGTKDQIPAGGSMDVTLYVKNPNTSAAILDAHLTIRVKDGPATLSLRDGYPGNVSNDKLSITGKTDGYGRFIVKLNAGNASANTSVILSAIATKEGYDEATAELGMKVRSDVPSAIVISQFDISPSTLYPGESAEVRVRVVYQNNIPLKGAIVYFSADPSGSMSPWNATTDPDGLAISTFTISTLIPENLTSLSVHADAIANFSGLRLSDSLNKSVSIVRRTPDSLAPPDQTKAFIIVLFIAAVVVFLAIILVMPKVMRRKVKTRRDPKATKKKPQKRQIK